MSEIIIAIDGYSSCGKSTLARALAAELNYRYIDSGAMYRAVTLFFLERGIRMDQKPEVESALDQIHIDFQHGPDGLITLLNGENVEEGIRSMAVAAKVSPVATIPEVRRALVRQQQALGRARQIVMDGRDIGTVVFPHAGLKIFLTASLEERVRRRSLQLLAKGMSVPDDEIRKNLLERDYIDSTRSDSPLMKAPDAVVLDNTNLTEEEQLLVAKTLALMRKRRSNLY
ncbi:MAG: (d)CMP kinase [Haliscomenobacter sp.]|nr:(d)CMP kinase [Haliscomenobacter sp.]MBK8877335.1 (d)CMP kinase [Haliscomenobacter sp.]